MPSSSPHRFPFVELEQSLRAVEPALRLVSPRVLRRVIKHDRGLPGIGLRVPHRKSYVISRDRLLALAEPHELDLEPGDELPPRVVLLEQPRSGRSDILLRCWQGLFHARIHCELETLTPEDARKRLQLLGRAETAEARAVLNQEQYLLAEDDRSVYIELAAVYLELQFFNPTLLPVYFPGLVAEHVQAVLAKDLDAPALLAATRPAGAADLPKAADIIEEEIDAEDLPEEQPAFPPAAPGQYRRLMDRADAAAGRGNLVRAAIWRARAAATPGYAAPAWSAARADLNRLARRFQRALGLNAEEARPLHRTLPALLEPAARGIWSVEARLLYDLQKVCFDHERPVYKAHLIDWLLTLGRRPLKRLLPGQEEVLALKHLRSALRRLAAARIADADRRRLSLLLHAAITHEETRLRDRFRPLIREALAAVALCPTNLPEQVALDKLVEELLDRVIDRGYLTMGDLRDALSRNQLKLPDLRGPEEFIRGDPLIQANRRLAEGLAGTYHRGEIYLRWLQRLSAAAFGTRPGRFLTRYLALPFGGAFMILKGLEEVIDLGLKLIPGDSHGHVHLLNGYSFALLGMFLLMLYVPAFRGFLGRGLAAAFHRLRWLLVDLPAGFAQLPLVRGVLASSLFQFAWRLVVKPLAFAAPLSTVFPLLGADAGTWAVGGALLFLGTTGLLNSRLGRDLEETAVDWVVHRWEQLRADIVPGMLRFVLAIFRRAVEEVERVLYTVDEWLRFRAGDSRLSFISKLVLGVGWFLIAYLVRVFINLFVEPTFNPIKHFPVVTVAAKVLAPKLLDWGQEITLALTPIMGIAMAGLVAGAAALLIPGFAGFMIWELKENWRLYRANRPWNLRPVSIGHHGETLPRLLRPGFHSGTLPKLYARMRKARRRAQRSGRWSAYFKQRDALHHVEEALRHFVEREFFVLLKHSRCPGMKGMGVGEVALGTNCVRIELAGPGSAAWLNFTEDGGRLLAELVEPGWIALLPARSEQAVSLALAGLYRLGGVNAVHEGNDVSLEPMAWERWITAWEMACRDKETA